MPDVSKHWVRWAVACIPPAADRVWEPTDRVATGVTTDVATDMGADPVTDLREDPDALAATSHGSVPDRTLLAR